MSTFTKALYSVLQSLCCFLALEERSLVVYFLSPAHKDCQDNVLTNENCPVLFLSVLSVSFLVTGINFSPQMMILTKYHSINLQIYNNCRISQLL